MVPLTNYCSLYLLHPPSDTTETYLFQTVSFFSPKFLLSYKSLGTSGEMLFGAFAGGLCRRMVAV